MSRFPILWVRTPSVTLYDQVSVPTFFDCVDRGLARGTHFVVLHDAREIPNVDEWQRKEFLSLLNERRPEIEQRVLGYAAIVSSPLERGIITAFTWFVRLALPLRIFTSEGEALSFCASRLAQASAGAQAVPRLRADA